VQAHRFAEVRNWPQLDRNRLGEILIRFYINGPLRHRLLNGDPNPGNSLFFDDGRVAFIDFGFFKHLSDEDVAQQIASTRATYEQDAQALFDVISGLGALPPDPSLAEPFLEAYTSIFGWLLVDDEVTIDSSATGAMMRAYTTMRDSPAFKSLQLPAEHFVLMRAVMLLIGLLGQLQAKGRWLDVAREWLLGGEPATPLGREEAEFFAGRPYPAPSR
jgi:predicted unusual protein kinase regulating ubiquinone biosynthesis (AarF/ABC1/UbiB family)